MTPLFVWVITAAAVLGCVLWRLTAGSRGYEDPTVVGTRQKNITPMTQVEINFVNKVTEYNSSTQFMARPR